ncbi:MAG: HAD-IA family hydrolase [Patescibacteria group bacterium]
MQDTLNLDGIKLVIFDLCGVLINVSWENMEEVLKKNSISIPAEFFRKTSEEIFQLHKFNHIEDGVDIFLKRLGLEDNKQLRQTQINFINNWGKLATQNSDGIKLLRLAQEHKLKTAVLSNVFPVQESWKKDWSIDNIDKFFFSYETGVQKPDKQAFLNAINYFGVKSSECLMIGDSNKKDIVPANELGMKTLYFGTKIVN